MMGSGKSSVGRALAQRTGWPFADNDELVERATGLSARELAAAGEPSLRAAESAALREGLRIAPPAIVATAAGTVLDQENRRMIEHGGFVAWLRAPVDVLAERAAGSAHRPWLDDDPVGWLEATLAEREPYYAGLADLEIDTAATPPEEAARLIAERVPARR
jgi:shikimate kinase